LKERGFETFSEVIDESYDNEINDTKRFEAVMKEIKRFFTENNQKDLHHIYYDVLYEKVRHNIQRHRDVVSEELRVILKILKDEI
jgi:hypothetical protein